MEEKKGKVAPTTTNPLTHGANVHNPNDLYKVLEYFRYTVGTTLDCFLLLVYFATVSPGTSEIWKTWGYCKLFILLVIEEPGLRQSIIRQTLKSGNVNHRTRNLIYLRRADYGSECITRTICRANEVQSGNNRG